MISWDDFEKIDMRVGTILEATDFEKARKPSFKLKIDFGNLGIKILLRKLRPFIAKKNYRACKSSL